MLMTLQEALFPEESCQRLRDGDGICGSTAGPQLSTLKSIFENPVIVIYLGDFSTHRSCSDFKDRFTYHAATARNDGVWVVSIGAEEPLSLFIRRRSPICAPPPSPRAKPVPLAPLRRRRYPCSTSHRVIRFQATQYLCQSWYHKAALPNLCAATFIPNSSFLIPNFFPPPPLLTPNSSFLTSMRRHHHS